MFGYIQIQKSEMKVKEYETYKAVYCALCREMGRRYGRITRLSLSYDLTFLALLCVGLSENEVSAEKKRCVCNPFKKCVYCNCRNAYSLPAAASVITLYYKAEDDARDEKGLKKISAKLLKLIYRNPHKKAAEDYPEIETLCRDYISAQKSVEEQETADLDIAANPTAEFMQGLFGSLTKDEKNKRVLYRLGYCLGRWLYLVDALDDMEKDRKTGAYNPFLCKEKCDGKENSKEIFSRSLMMSEAEAQAAHELLENHRLRTVTENILYLGLEKSRKKVRSNLNERPV